MEKAFFIFQALYLNRTLSIVDISIRYAVSERTVYRYIDMYKRVGFKVCKLNVGIYSIDEALAKH